MLLEIEKDYAREKERTGKLNNENQQLTKYIDLEWKLGDSQRGWNSTPQNKTSINKKLKELKTQAQKPLNLVEIIGLDLQLFKLKDPNSIDSFYIDFSTTNPPDPQPEHGSVAFRKSKYE